MATCSFGLTDQDITAINEEAARQCGSSMIDSGFRASLSAVATHRPTCLAVVAETAWASGEINGVIIDALKLSPNDRRLIGDSFLVELHPETVDPVTVKHLPSGWKSPRVLIYPLLVSANGDR